MEDYQLFIKEFACIAQPLHEHLSGGGAHKKSEQLTLMVGAKDTFEAFKKACLDASMLAFSDFEKSFLLETDASKLGVRAMLSQNRPMVNTIW